MALSHTGCAIMISGVPGAPKRAPRLRLKCFGVGDGWPSADRGHSSFLYQFEKNAFLFDCGEPISRSFKASGLDYNLVDHLILSHLHFDHIGGFFMLVQGFWLEGRTRTLTVHAPADGIGPLRQMLQAGCIFDELLPFPLEFEALEPKATIQSDNVKVTPFPTTHLASIQRTFQAKYKQSFAAFSFLIEAGELRIAHSADIGAASDLEPLLERPVDLLVCELAHVGAEELFSFLAGRPVRQILFVHLSRQHRNDHARIQHLAKRALAPVKVAFPEEGDEIAL